MKKDHPPPPIELDDQDVRDLMILTREQLDKIDHDVLRWTCGFRGCRRTTGVRDYGVAPWYYATNLKGGARWITIPRNMMTCREHGKFLERMIDQYGPDHTFRRCLKPVEKLYELTSKKISK